MRLSSPKQCLPSMIPLRKPSGSQVSGLCVEAPAPFPDPRLPALARGARERLLIRGALFVCVSKGGGLAGECREGHSQCVHPIGGWRLYYDFDCFVQGNHCCDLKMGWGWGATLNTLNSEPRATERVSMQNATGYAFKLTFKFIFSVKMWGHVAVNS